MLKKILSLCEFKKGFSSIIGFILNAISIREQADQSPDGK